MKAVSKIFPVDIYKRGLLVCFGTLAELYKVAKGALSDENKARLEQLDFSHTTAVCICTESDAIIYAPNRPADEVIAHELNHATFQILRKVDIDPTASEEAYTYLFEYLYHKVFLWLNALDDVREQSSAGDD